MSTIPACTIAQCKSLNLKKIIWCLTNIYQFIFSHTTINTKGDPPKNKKSRRRRQPRKNNTLTQSLAPIPMEVEVDVEVKHELEQMEIE